MQPRSATAPIARPKAVSLGEYVGRMLSVLDRIHRAAGVVDAAAAAELDTLEASLDQAARATGRDKVLEELELRAVAHERRGHSDFARAAGVRLQAAGFTALLSPRAAPPAVAPLAGLLGKLDNAIARAEGAALGPAAVTVPLAHWEALVEARARLKGCV